MLMMKQRPSNTVLRPKMCATPWFSSILVTIYDDAEAGHSRSLRWVLAAQRDWCSLHWGLCPGLVTWLRLWEEEPSSQQLHTSSSGSSHHLRLSQTSKMNHKFGNCQAQGQGQGQGQSQSQSQKSKVKSQKSKLDPEVGFVMGWSTHPHHHHATFVELKTAN